MWEGNHGCRKSEREIVAFLKGVFANFNEQAHQDLSEHKQQLECVCVDGREEG
jgi:hypothetical protein